MIEFFGDVITVIIALWLYDKIKDWRQYRRYGG